MRSWPDNKKKWIILILCCMVACANGGIINAHGVFITPVTEGLDISQTAYSLTATITTLTASFLTLIIPILVIRFKSKIVMLAGALISVGGYFLASRMTGIVSLAISLFMRRAGYHLLGNTVLLMTINEWFVSDSGFASSIVMSCYGLAGAILSPLFAWGIENRSWRYGYLIATVISIVMYTVPLASPIRLTRAVVEDEDPEQRNLREEVVFPYKRRSMPVLIVYAAGIISYMNVAFAEYLSSIAITKGMSLSTGALFASAVMMGNIVSKLLNGWLSDSIGATRTAAVMCLVCSCGALAILFSKSRPIMFVASFFFGALYSISGLSLSLVNKELFGKEKFAEAFSRTSFVSSMVYAALYPLWGLAYDFTGGYTLTMIVTIAVTILLAPFLLYLDSKRKQLAAGTDNS